MCWTSAASFFVEASLLSREARWKAIFEMAWGSEGKGLVINLAEVPDDILNLMTGWRNEKVEAENEQHSKRQYR